MKFSSLLAFLALLFLGLNSLVLAQSVASAPHPKIKEVHARLQEQKDRIIEALKNGTLTQDQANDLMLTLKSIREQMNADYSTNGNHELTEDQKAQLNQMLDSNSKLIYSEKRANRNSSTTQNSNSASMSYSSSSAPAPTGK